MTAIKLRLQAFRGNQVTCLKILPQQIQEIVDLVGQHQEKAPEFLDLLNIIVKVVFFCSPGLSRHIVFLLHVPCPFPRPLSAQHSSSLIGKHLSILFSVVFCSFSLVYPSSTLSSVYVLHLSSSHARTSSTISMIF